MMNLTEKVALFCGDDEKITNIETAYVEIGDKSIRYRAVYDCLVVIIPEEHREERHYDIDIRIKISSIEIIDLSLTYYSLKRNKSRWIISLYTPSGEVKIPFRTQDTARGIYDILCELAGL